MIKSGASSGIARVMAVGGYNFYEDQLSSVEIYNEETSSWTDGPLLPIAVYAAAAIGDSSGTNFRNLLFFVTGDRAKKLESLSLARFFKWVKFLANI